jgi:molybdopterin-containing oxidoreductase family membrane subunit
MNSGKGLLTIWLGILAAGILLGLLTAFRLLTEGHVLFNTSDVVIWTLPLGAYVFLALTSSGLTLVSAIPLVFGATAYEPLAKRLVFLAIATLAGAFSAIGLELGALDHMIYLMLSPNLSSPIWWMGTLYSIELVLLLAEFWKMHTGDSHSRLTRTLGIASFLCAVFAPLIIGAVFGITEARPTFFGSFMSTYCLAVAFVSGLAAFLLYSMVYHQVRGGGIPEAEARLYNGLSRIFGFSMGITLLFYVLGLAVKTATTFPDFGTKVHFQLLLGLIVPYAMMVIPSVRRTGWGKTAASAIALISILGMHMEVLLAGQVRPVGPKAEGLAEFVSYSPSVWEWLVLVFALSVILLLYTLGERHLSLGGQTEPAGVVS